MTPTIERTAQSVTSVVGRSISCYLKYGVEYHTRDVLFAKKYNIACYIHSWLILFIYYYSFLLVKYYLLYILTKKLKFKLIADTSGKIVLTTATKMMWFLQIRKIMSNVNEPTYISITNSSAFKMEL